MSFHIHLLGVMHSLSPPLSDGFGAGDGVPPAPPPVTARKRVLIAMPIAVRMLSTIIPCSRKRVRIHSASVLSSWRSRLMVSRILLVCDRRAALFVERASSLACLSSSMSESLPLNFSIRSRISCWISVSSFSVSFRRSLAKCFSTSDFRSLMALSFARLLASSSLDLVMASQTPTSSFLACVTHAVSIGGSLMVFNVVSMSSALCLVVSATPERFFSSIASMFFGRVSSALWSVFTTSLPSLHDIHDI